MRAGRVGNEAQDIEGDGDNEENNLNTMLIFHSEGRYYLPSTVSDKQRILDGYVEDEEDFIIHF